MEFWVEERLNFWVEGVIKEKMLFRFYVGWV